MQDQNSASLRGHFLMAMPSLSDPNFYKTVTLISEHTPEGAVGIVINQVHSALTAKIIFKELEIESTIPADTVPIHIGGPVHINEIFVLHGPPVDWGGSLVIQPDLALSNSKTIIEAIAKGNGPEAFIISLGCAGWGPGQLEYELKENVWLTSHFARDIAFEIPVEQRWEISIQRIGIDPALLSSAAGHA